MSRRSIVGVVVAVAFAVLATSAGPAVAYSGTIDGGTANATWTQGSVQNLSLAMDLCGSDGQPTCQWAALAGVMPAANGSCPSDWYTGGPAAKVTMFYSSGYQTANGTVSSGPRTFSMNGAHGQRLCLWLERTFTGTGLSASWVVTHKLVTPEPEATTPTGKTCPKGKKLKKGKCVKKKRKKKRT